MTQGLREFFDLPEMNTVTNTGDADVPDQEVQDEYDEDVEETAKILDNASERLAMVDGKDHGDAMDGLYKETLQHARDVMELGFNIDQMKAARMFEVATGLYGKAMEAKNSKRDAQLKTMKLALEQRRLDIMERQVAPKGDDMITGDATIVVGDRNELLRKMRENMKKDN